MYEKIGRNDPCICGSGNKYKKCCMNKDLSCESNQVLDFAWRKLRKTEGEVIDKHLMPFLKKELPAWIIPLAFNEFCPEGLPEEIDRGFIFDQCFLPWLLFNWIPGEDLDLEEPPEQFDLEQTIAKNYLTKHRNSLSSTIISFIEAMNRTYYSFYVVQEMVLDKSLKAKDILLGTEHSLKEKAATRSLKKGNIVFSRILNLENQSIFIGMIPYIIPPHYYDAILDFKKWLVQENDDKDLDHTVLQEFSDHELVDYFFAILTELYNQPLPQLHNTDGDPIIFSKSYFKISLSPYEVLQILLPLTLSKDPKDFLSEAKRNKIGDIIKITFPWLKKGNKKHNTWDNTIMGNIIIDGNKLTLETNSQKRTEKGKQLLHKYLDEAIEFHNTLLETPEQKLNSAPKRGSNQDNEQEEMLALPEVQKQLKQMANTHWKKWFDEKIPALEHKTPREAVKTKDGRERLEALLLEYEYHDAKARDAQKFFSADINYLKKELGL